MSASLLGCLDASVFKFILLESIDNLIGDKVMQRYLLLVGGQGGQM
jgi:hypothetical protein